MEINGRIYDHASAHSAPRLSRASPHQALGPCGSGLGTSTGEVGQDAQAHPLALLGVKLNAHCVALGDHRGEIHAVVGFGHQEGRVRGLDIVGVDKVGEGAIGHAF